MSFFSSVIPLLKLLCISALFQSGCGEGSNQCRHLMIMMMMMNRWS